MSKKKEKYLVVRGKIEMIFGVAGLSKEDAKENAGQKVRKLLDTSLVGAFGWNFEIEDIKGLAPIDEKTKDKLGI